ncbi:MAG: S8 family serine peptidase, partial [Lachnospiraceae bacterium]|nr:S8 family serine peptidase [Lachnospiraceae bacterium]
IVLNEPAVLDAGYKAAGIAANAAANSYRESLADAQASLTERIEQNLGRPLNVKWNLTLAVNVISAEVRRGDIALIEKVEGVKAVQLENRYDLQTDEAAADGTEAASPQTSNTSGYMVGAQAAWSSGYTGAGSRIAIIDTGIDETHQSFDEAAFLYAIEQVESTGKEIELFSDIPLSSLNGKGRRVSSKIPYAYNYVDRNQNINHLKDTQGEHGSHVAGIAAANRFIPKGDGFVDAAANVYAVGMAPDAQLFIMKVFGANGGAHDSDYMAALEDAIVLECDAVNLSLGSASPGYTYDNVYQGVLNRLTQDDSGTVMSVSAGNAFSLAYHLKRDLYVEDITMHTGGSPGTYFNTICIASADNIGKSGTPLTFNDKLSVYYTEAVPVGTALTTIAGSYDYVYIDGTGSVSDYERINEIVPLEGKIVIVNRGEITFSEKANNLSAFRPAALFVANNVSGIVRMSMANYTGTFPVVSLTLEDAYMIRDGSEESSDGNLTYYTGNVVINDVFETSIFADREDAVISSFSSWGIPETLIMKPEITAPGGNIYSVFGKNVAGGGGSGGSDKYEIMSGTSMAAPHITGLAAVIAQYLRENDLHEMNEALAANYSIRAIVHSLLMSTATPMRPNDRYISILRQGAGLADVNAAVNASSVIMMGAEDDTLTALTGQAADGKVKVELGDDPARAGEYNYSFTIYNTSDEDLEFDVSTDLFTQAAKNGQKFTYMSEDTSELEAEAIYSWERTLSTLEHDVDRDGDTDADDARAILKYLAGAADGEAFDLAAGEMDGEEGLTSYDAHLLLEALEGEDILADGIVRAHTSRRVSVTLRLTEEQKAQLDAVYTKGAYIEGYT